MVLQGIKDGVDIQDNHQSYSKTFMYYFLLGLNVLVWLVLMFGSVFAIGFLAETPHTVDVFHVLFAITRHALTAAVWKVLSAALDLLVRRKSPQVRNFSQADEHRPGQLPT